MIWKKINGQWKKVTVYSKVNGQWVQSNNVKLKHNGQWVDTQSISLVDDAANPADIESIDSNNVQLDKTGAIAKATLLNVAEAAKYVYGRLSTKYPALMTRTPSVGEEYQISFRVKASNPNKVSIALYQWTGSSTRPKTSEWETMVVTNAIASGNASSFLSIRFVDDATNGDTIEVDMASFKIERQVVTK